MAQVVVRGERSWPFLMMGVVMAALGGCGTASTPTATPAAPHFAGLKIGVAAIGDAALLPLLAAQRGEWEASRKAECRVIDHPVTPTDLGGAHVVVFPGEQLGTLVDAGVLAVLPERVVRGPKRSEDETRPETSASETASEREPEADELQFDDVLPAFREQVSKNGRDRMGLPLGGSALVLVYNRAAFDSEANRKAAKEAGVALEPPTTWASLQGLARFFQGRDWDGDNTPDHGIALVLGRDAEGMGDATFLARAASLGQHPDHYSLLFDADSMEPRLTSPPFVEALEGLLQLRTAAPPGVEKYDAAAARQAFRDGRVALLIDRAERASAWAGGKARLIGVAPLPGSERVFEPARKAWETPRTPNRPSYLPAGGGWLVGVAATASGAEQEAAIDLARYLANPETSSRLRTDPSFPMLPVRASQIGQGPPDARAAVGVEPRLWSEAVGKTLAAARVVPGLRIPDAAGYLTDLAEGRVAALEGKPVEAALAAVSSAWTERTRKLGLARQTWHYRRSLNSLATTPRPPARDGG